MFERFVRQLGQVKLPEKEIDALRAKMRPAAEDSVRLSFILSAIAEKEKIAASDAELASELESALKDSDNEQKKAEMRELFERRKDQIAHMIRERKVMALLREKAVYKDA